jgi:hypothetical protein
MRVLKMVLVSAAVLLVPAVASADPAQTQTVPAATAQPAPAPKETVTVTAKAASDPDEVMCKSSPAPTGSRLGGSRECHTQREWDNRMRESQRITSGNQMMGLQGPLNSPGGH